MLFALSSWSFFGINILRLQCGDIITDVQVNSLSDWVRCCGDRKMNEILNRALLHMMVSRAAIVVSVPKVISSDAYAERLGFRPTHEKNGVTLPSLHAVDLCPPCHGRSS